MELRSEEIEKIEAQAGQLFDKMVNAQEDPPSVMLLDLMCCFLLYQRMRSMQTNAADCIIASLMTSLRDFIVLYCSAYSKVGCPITLNEERTNLNLVNAINELEETE